MSKNKSLSIVLFAYSLCFITFFFVLKKINYGIFYDILIVDVIATVIIYFFSFYFKNSSIYDPYWSVIPPIILFYFICIVNEINFQAYFLLFSSLFFAI